MNMYNKISKYFINYQQVLSAIIKHIKIKKNVKTNSHEL